MKVKIEGRDIRGLCFAGERSTAFDAMNVDHDQLALMIGRAVVRAVNAGRDLRLDLLRTRYNVSFIVK